MPTEASPSTDAAIDADQADVTADESITSSTAAGGAVRRWLGPGLLAVVGGVAVAVGILWLTARLDGPRPVRTQVAGISVERPSTGGASDAADSRGESRESSAPSTAPASGSADSRGGAASSEESPPVTSAPSDAASPSSSSGAVSTPSAVGGATPAPAATAPNEAAAVGANGAGSSAGADDPASLRDRVLAEIAFPWQSVLPGWQIEFLPERPGYRGSTFPKKKLIQIYERSGLTFADYVHVTAHEMGHAVDVTLLTDADHAQWNQARGRSADATWWADSGADDFSTGAGDWAECFAWSQLPSGRFYSRLGGAPNAAQLQAMAAIITHAMTTGAGNG